MKWSAVVRDQDIGTEGSKDEATSREDKVPSVPVKSEWNKVAPYKYWTLTQKPRARVMGV